MRPKPQSLRDLREYPILYVDDEPENLRIFELAFRRDFEILTAESGERGLEIINTMPVAIVLSDHRMPGMQGTEFLARASEIDPQTVRIMVTAYGDAETLRDAINNGSIYHFIPKPWEPDDVRATLIRAVEAYALDRERSQLLLELMVLHRVSRELNGEHEPGRVVELLSKVLQEDLGFDGAGILLAEQPGGTLRLAASGPRSDAADPLRVDPGTTPELYESLQSGHSQTLHLDQADYYPDGLRRWVTELAAEEILVTPLHGKEGLIGAVAIDNRSGGGALSADDGTLVEGLCNQAAIAIENARLVGELRGSRERVRQAERLGTLGTLSAELAHEIGGPLDAIRAFLGGLPARRGAPPDDPFWGEELERVGREAERIGELVASLRRLGERGMPGACAEAVRPERIVREAAAVCRREARLAGVRLRVHCEPGTPKVVAVPDQLHQVVLNLVQNALAATPPGGTVQVLTRAAADAEGLEIEVQDTGTGIAPEQLEQIFDPFFTTKGGDPNAGLGLMICQRIVADHGGAIEVRPGEPRGARFVVQLPLEKPPTRH